MPWLGWDTVTVPGAVSAWAALSEKFGALPFQELFRPAIHYARNGFLVSPITAKMWGFAPDKYKDFPGFREAFLLGGRAPLPGELFSFSEQAESLELIAGTGGAALYDGELARKIAEYSDATGGMLTEEDLAAHSAEWVKPISLDYRGFTLHELPPNGQGIAALMALGILEDFDLAKHPVDSTESLHLQIEAMKLAFADVHRHVADPGFMELEPERLLSRDYLARRAKSIHPDKAQNPGPGNLGGGDTVYLTTADESGMMVSFIQSNFGGFGSGIVVPKTGIALQNRGSGFSLEKGHPNQVDGKKRPYHTIIPAFLTWDREPVMSFGVMGGPFQPQGHLQVLVRMLDYQQNPQTSIDAPRWQVFPDMELAVEPGFGEQELAGLARLGHRITTERQFWWFGGAQAIFRLEDGYCAASDPRKDGQAAGF